MLSLGHRSVPVRLSAGVSPTFFSREKYGPTDFDSPLQFTSHIGLNARLNSRLALGYRFQHTSNAGLGRHNPGLNLNMIALGCRF